MKCSKRPPQAEYWYSGVLNLEKMDAISAFAWRCYKNQKTRCYNKKTSNFDSYGGKGIRVDYQARELIGWVLANKDLFLKIKIPNIGRIDHSDHYRIGNIELVSKSENTKEMLKRTGNPANKSRSKRVAVVCKKTKSILYIAPSIAAPGKWANLDPSNVSRRMRGMFSNKKSNYEFKKYG